jgi:hypothetical protein
MRPIVSRRHKRVQELVEVVQALRPDADITQALLESNTARGYCKPLGSSTTEVARSADARPKGPAQQKHIDSEGAHVQTGTPAEPKKEVATVSVPAKPSQQQDAAVPRAVAKNQPAVTGPMSEKDIEAALRCTYPGCRVIVTWAFEGDTRSFVWIGNAGEPQRKKGKRTWQVEDLIVDGDRAVVHSSLPCPQQYKGCRVVILGVRIASPEEAQEFRLPAEPDTPAGPVEREPAVPEAPAKTAKEQPPREPATGDTERPLSADALNKYTDSLECGDIVRVE